MVNSQNQFKLVKHSIKSRKNTDSAMPSDVVKYEKLLLCFCFDLSVDLADDVDDVEFCWKSLSRVDGQENEFHKMPYQTIQESNDWKTFGSVYKLNF